MVRDCPCGHLEDLQHHKVFGERSPSLQPSWGKRASPATVAREGRWILFCEEGRSDHLIEIAGEIRPLFCNIFFSFYS